MRVLLGLAFFAIISLNSCKKGESATNTPAPSNPSAGTIPSITTNTVSAITKNTASSGGVLLSNGGSAILAQGIVWSTNPSPSINLTTKTVASLSSSFTSEMTGLNPNTSYYVRAYATNANGTAYGTERVFTTLSSGNVYVVGYESNGTKDVAKFWKNGVATALSDGLHNAKANSIYVSNGDVYVTGYNTEEYISGRVWKNTAVSSKSSFTPKSIFVSGSDVYFAADYPVGSNYVSSYYKNSSYTVLSNSSNLSAADGLFVSGNDVYVAGNVNAGNYRIAKVWKNGVATNLSDGTSNVLAYAVYVSGQDVYVVGEEMLPGVSIAKLWKNGVATNLTNGSNDARANSVFVLGSDVYVAGVEYSGTLAFGSKKAVAKLWKNGVATSLSNGTTNAYAQSVFVAGTDVYVAGYENNGTKDVAKLWKNGVAINMSNGTTNAQLMDVFVD